MTFNLYSPLAYLSVLIGTSVILSGMHAKDISAMSLSSAGFDANPFVATKKVADDGYQFGHVYKTPSDLHNHVDKQMFKSVLKVSSDQPQADHRSLKRIRHSYPKKNAGVLHKQLFRALSLITTT